jgi:hypothetical protein
MNYIWTSNKPTIFGWYFYRLTEKDDFECVKVCQWGPYTVVHGIGRHAAISHWHGEWAGPITVQDLWDLSRKNIELAEH